MPLSSTSAPPEGLPVRPALERFDAAFCALNRWLLVGLLAVMALLVTGNVFSRYAIGHSFSWVEEATRYMMIWTTFLGAGPALRVGGHIAIDSLPDALPARLAKGLRGGVVVIVGATLLAMVWLGWDYADFAWEQESPVLGWSLGKVYLALPAGALMTLLHLGLVTPRWVGTGKWEQVEGFDPQAL